MPGAAVAWAGVLAGLAVGCTAGGTHRSLAPGLQSEDASERIRASVQAGSQHDVRAVPLLVERLEDNSADARLFAIRALEKITGQTLGYRYYAPPEQRAEAVGRWREWVKTQRPADKED
ncbi:MAG: hypothetical protein AMJ81_07860 [Phycisphaerae bacterium SM23_33]|nr:MAG: hypothetical protein AMJ81_07860 [Phycisphaerae bacterium SM23_33]